MHVGMSSNNQKEDSKMGEKLRTVCSLFCIVFAISLLGCAGETEKENAKLRKEIGQLQAQIAQLKAEKENLEAMISDLQQTDDYYYKMAISSRQKEDYIESNKYLEQMIEKFPQSSFIKEAKGVIEKNNSNIAQELYDKAITLQRQGKYAESNAAADQLLTKFPKSSLIKKAEQVKLDNKAKLKEEQASTRKIGSWKGTGIKNTEPFTITKVPWIIAWGNRSSQYGGILQIFVYRTNGELVNLVANTMQDESDISYIYEKGSFYLNINAANTNWVVEVHETK